MTLCLRPWLKQSLEQALEQNGTVQVSPGERLQIIKLEQLQESGITAMVSDKAYFVECFLEKEPIDQFTAEYKVNSTQLGGSLVFVKKGIWEKQGQSAVLRLLQFEYIGGINEPPMGEPRYIWDHVTLNKKHSFGQHPGWTGYTHEPVLMNEMMRRALRIYPLVPLYEFGDRSDAYSFSSEASNFSSLDSISDS